MAKKSELVMLFIKIPSIYDATTIEEFRKGMIKVFIGVDGYDVRFIFVPTMNPEVSIECIYPNKPVSGKELVEKLDYVLKEIDAIACGDPSKSRRAGKIEVTIG